MWLVENEYPVRVPIGDIKYDHPVMQDLREALDRWAIDYDEYSIADESIFSVTDLINQIASTDLVVSSRFHNFLLAIMLNKPVVSISYDAKNDALMAGVGLKNYCQSIDSMNVDELIEQFLKI